MDIEQEFFDTFEIKPRVYKGETYCTVDYRFVQREAEEDIWWDLNIIELEELLGSFVLHHDNLYEYSTVIWSKPVVGYKTRKEALLRFLINNKEHYKSKIQEMFKRRY